MKSIGAIASGAAILAAIGLILRKNYMDAYRGTHEQVFNFISKLEKFSPKAFWDYKQWSVGYGSGYNFDTMQPVTKDTVIDQNTAKRWLLAKASSNMDTINYYVRVPINANQRTALLSFVYNVGDSAFIHSDLLKKINGRATKQDIINTWKTWVYAGGIKNNGLIDRRNKEVNMYFS
jgi:lysozyme